MQSDMESNVFKQIAVSIVVFLALVGCTGQTQDSEAPEEVFLEDFGPAPELKNETWLNTEQPLHLENLRGKVVLLDMWTFG